MIIEENGDDIRLEDSDVFCKIGNKVYYLITLDNVDYLLRFNEGGEAMTYVFIHDEWFLASMCKARWVFYEYDINDLRKSLSKHILETEKRVCELKSGT